MLERITNANPKSKEASLNYLLSKITNFIPDAHLNPFKGVKVNPRKKPLTIKKRLQQTYEIFAGKQSEEKPLYYVPSKAKQGLFSYLIGIPSHLAYSIITGAMVLAFIVALAVPAAFLVVIPITPPIMIFVLTAEMEKSWQKWLIRALTSPLWLPLAVAAIAPAMALGVAASVAAILLLLAEAVLYPINLFVQRVVVPRLSQLATFLVKPIVHLVHWALTPPPPPKDESVLESSSTAKTFQQIPQLNSSESAAPSQTISTQEQSTKSPYAIQNLTLNSNSANNSAENDRLAVKVKDKNFDQIRQMLSNNSTPS